MVIQKALGLGMGREFMVCTLGCAALVDCSALPLVPPPAITPPAAFARSRRRPPETERCPFPHPVLLAQDILPTLPKGMPFSGLTEEPKKKK